MKRTKKSILSGIGGSILWSKFVGNNTVHIKYADGTEAIRLHDTDIVTYASNKIILSSGGWRTRTTKDRINDRIYRFGISINQNNNVWYIGKGVFYDGITFDNEGNQLSEIKPDTQKEVKEIKKRIAKFVKGITKDNLPYPDGGDCWYCSMYTEKGNSLGDSFNDTDHLLSHLEENYIHGSLLVNAMRESGYTDKQIGVHYGMKWDAAFRRSVSKYLTKRLTNI